MSTPKLDDASFVGRAARAGLRPDYCGQCGGVLVRDFDASIYRCATCHREGTCREEP